MRNAVVSIYRLDPAHIQADFLSRDIEFEGFTFSEVIDEIMDKRNESLKLPYTDQLFPIATSLNIDAIQGIADTNEIEIDLSEMGLETKMYHGRIETDDNWGPFFSGISAGNDRFQNIKNHQHSFLLFIIASDEIYVMTSGLAYHQVGRYIDEYFGVTILSHLIDSNNTDIRSLQDNALYGNTLSSDRLFGKDFKIINEDSFGKIYKKILATVNFQDLQREFPFAFEQADQRSRNCLGKSHFTIYKSISINQAILLVCKLHLIFSRGMNPNLKISNIRMLKARKASDKGQIDNLNNAILDDLGGAILSGQPANNYLILHKDVAAFFSAHKYLIKIGVSRRTIFHTDDMHDISIEYILGLLQADPQIQTSLNNALSKPTDQARWASLQNIFDRVYISLENPNYPRRIEEPLFKFLQCEIDDSGKSFYNLNDKWFTFDRTLSKQVDTELTDLMEGIQDQNIARRSWQAAHDETDYIQTYLQSANYFPIHKIKPGPHSIELADIIRIGQNGEVCLIHIKDGFDHKFRELSSQVLTSAKLLNDDLKTNNRAWLKSIYQQIKNNRSTDAYYTGLRVKFMGQWPTEATFLTAMKHKDISFCLAFTGNPSNHSVKDLPNRYTSLIAKMSLISTDRQFGIVKDRGWSLKVCQINNV
jgi:hypothetical protein